MSGHPASSRRQRDPKPRGNRKSRAVHTSQREQGRGDPRGRRVRDNRRAIENTRQQHRTDNRISTPHPFEIGEVPPEEYEEGPESAGRVEDWWVQREREKAKMRPYITGAVVFVWAACTIACIIQFLLTGAPLLLAMPELIGVPLAAILWFYYGWLSHKGG